MQLKSVSERQAILVGRLKARDPQALAELYDQFGSYVFRMAHSRVRNVDTAEHLTQDTFLYIWTRIDGFDVARGSLATWIGMVVRSRSVDYLRSVECRMERQSTPLEDADRSASLRTGEGGFKQVESMRMLEGPWKKLKECERRVLSLAYYSGLSQPEIAQQLNQPLGTVKTWIRRGLMSMRAQLTNADAV